MSFCPGFRYKNTSARLLHYTGTADIAWNFSDVELARYITTKTDNQNKEGFPTSE